MEFNEKLRHALQMLEAKGLGKSTYAPPLFRLLWKLGARVPPPHMAGFASNLLVMGGFFGFFWGLCMWLLMWGRQGMPAWAGAALALFAGVLFGVIMALYLRLTSKRKGIPQWDAFAG